MHYKWWIGYSNWVADAWCSKNEVGPRVVERVIMLVVLYGICRMDDLRFKKKPLTFQKSLMARTAVVMIDINTVTEE